MKNYYRASSRKSVLIWGFTALWLGGIAFGTWSAIFNGVLGPAWYPGWYPFVVLAALWVMGGLLTCVSNKHPCTSVTVKSDGVVEGQVTFPFRVVRRMIRSDEIIPLQLTEHEYESGGAFFVLRLQVQLVPGYDMVIAEGSREHCIEVETAFLAALERSKPESTKGIKQKSEGG